MKVTKIRIPPKPVESEVKYKLDLTAEEAKILVKYLGAVSLPSTTEILGKKNLLVAEIEQTNTLLFNLFCKMEDVGVNNARN